MPILTDEQRHATRRAEMRATNEAMAALMLRIAAKWRAMGHTGADVEKFEKIARDIRRRA